ATTFQNGTRLQDTSSDTTTTNMNCWDENTAGNVFNFNSPSGNPLCRAALLWVQEQTGGFNYCWFGRGSPADTGNGATEDANGQCRTPTTMTLGTNVSSGSSSYSLDVGTLTGNIRAQDTIVLSESNTTTTCTYASGAGGAAANYYIGSSSTISVSNCTTSGSPVTFDSSALVYDKSAFDALNPSATNTYNTISSLDTAHGQGNPIYLTPVTGNHTTDTNAAVQLSRQGGSLDTRTFYIGVYLPSSTGSGQNSLQGIQSTFGIGWHIDQQ
ncbi:MAG: hypothetical protein ACRDLR_04395, partial [Gaiellaceae bacterium]